MKKMIGIVDALGIESFIPFEGNESCVAIFNLRAQANKQRNAVSYCLDFTNIEISRIGKFINSSEELRLIKAGKIVTKRIDEGNKTFHTETNKKLYEVYKLRGYL